VIKTTKCHSWVVQTHASRIQMVDGRNVGKMEKSQYLRSGLTDRREICHDDAFQRSLPFQRLKFVEILKICGNFKNPTWRRTRSLPVSIRPEVVLAVRRWQIGLYIVVKSIKLSGTASSFMWFPLYFYFRFPRRR